MLISGALNGRKIGAQMKLLLLGIVLVRLFPNRVERIKGSRIHELEVRKHDSARVWDEV